MGSQKNAAGKGCGRAVRANLRKERRRRNTFRVGPIQTPQMPSCHNRLLPSALLFPTRRLSTPYSHNRLCLSPSSSSYSPTSFHRFTLFFRHHPALEGVSAPLFASSTLSVLSRFFSRHALTSPSLSLHCLPPQLLLSRSDTSHNGLISPRSCLFK